MTEQRTVGDILAENPQLPGERGYQEKNVSKVDAAIAVVMAGIKRLGREDRNGQGGYNFASIDAFLEMTGKLCAAAKLIVIMDEEGFEIVPDFVKRRDGKVPGLQMRFAITLRCDGEEAGPYRRSIIVPSDMGSQAFGAAQSYVLKQFLRATFQIPTGDKGEDLDAHDTGSIAVPLISAEQCTELRQLIGKADAEEGAFVEYLRCGTLPELPAARFAQAKRALEQRAKAMETK